MDRLHHIQGMISDSAINFRNGTYLLVILNVYSILSMNFPVLGLIEGSQSFFFWSFLECVMLMPYCIRDKIKGLLRVVMQAWHCNGAFTLADTETETDNRDTERNGNLCSYPSLCSMNKSTKF